MRYGRADSAIVRPTIDGVAYTAGDVVGGIQELPLRASAGGSGILVHVAVTDLANQKPALTILFFKALPIGIYTNNAPPQPNDADHENFLGKVEITSNDWTTIVANTWAVATVDCSLGLKGDETRKVYAVAVTSGTPDYADVDELIFNYQMQLD